LITILSVNIGLFLHLANKIDNWRSDLAKETKDFHGRLCSLEARYHDEKYKTRTDP
jgi:hypothetical protein